jgi:hypothetical protein
VVITEVGTGPGGEGLVSALAGLANLEADTRLQGMCERYDFLDKLVVRDLPDAGVRVRLHLYRDGYFDRPHNHRWSFASRILRGQYVHRIFGRDAELTEDTGPGTLRAIHERIETPGAAWGIEPAAGPPPAARARVNIVACDRAGNRTWFSVLRGVDAEPEGVDVPLLAASPAVYIDCCEVLGDAPWALLAASLTAGADVTLNLGGDDPHGRLDDVLAGDRPPRRPACRDLSRFSHVKDHTKQSRDAGRPGMCSCTRTHPWAGTGCGACTDRGGGRVGTRPGPSHGQPDTPSRR